MNKRSLCEGLSAVAIAAAVFMAPPALADVKTGVDAWSRGDYAAAVREWQGSAARGDADAQFNLAQAFRSGRGVKQDLRKAEELFGRAAAQGHLQAADNYGLMLFQRGERAIAMPYITAAADRGDPRAQYYLGLAYFNGDVVTKDWVRGYALVSLASQAGLEQARPALAQMDRYVPLAERQRAVALAGQLSVRAQTNRARQLAAVELGSTTPMVPVLPPARIAQPASPSVAAARDATSAAVHVERGSDPRTAGADYARPAPAPAPTSIAQSTAATAQPARPRLAPIPPTAPHPPTAGAWRVQLGAFSVAGNADALWSKVRRRPELAGHARLDVRSGRVTKLQAGGFASQSRAASACTRLSAAGIACLPTRD